MTDAAKLLLMAEDCERQAKRRRGNVRVAFTATARFFRERAHLLALAYRSHSNG